MSTRLEEEVVSSALRRWGRGDSGPASTYICNPGEPTCPCSPGAEESSLISYLCSTFDLMVKNLLIKTHTHTRMHTHRHTRHTHFKIVSRYREETSGFHWGERRGEGQDKGKGLRCRNYCVVCARSFQCIPLFVIPWTVACQALLSMGFSRQEYWSGLPCPPPGDLANPEI